MSRTPIEIAEANGAIAILRDLREEVASAREAAMTVAQDHVPSAQSVLTRPFDYVLDAIDDRIEGIEELLRS